MTPGDAFRFRQTLTLLAMIAITTGCGRPADQHKPSASSANAPLPPTIAVDVNGKALDREQAEAEAQYRLRTLAQNVPPEQQAQLEHGIRHRIAEQFVTKTLLAQEAEARGFKATDEEIEQEYDAIRAKLPPGRTLEEIKRARPAHTRKKHLDIIDNIIINKLLAALPPNALTVSKKEIDKFYSNIRRARHILIKADKDASESERAEKEAFAHRIRQQINQGEVTFERAAQQHSDCPSADKGGYLGHFPKGQMVPEFDRAAFSQAVGEVGPVVASPFGYHIIQVMENDIGPSDPLAEDNVRRELQRTKQTASIDALVDALKKNAVIRYAPDFAKQAE